MFSIRLDYPSSSEEVDIVRRTTGAEVADLKVALGAGEILEHQALVRRIPVSDYVLEYAVRLARSTRPRDGAPEFVRNYVSWGAGPRASQFLILGAKARAALRGKPTPTHEDVKAVAPAVLRHRLVANFNAEAEGVSNDDVISRLIESVPVEPPPGA
jgi:MoxR-like ATPase